MFRRRRLWFVLIAGVALAVGVWWWVSSQTLWVKEADRVAAGMTLHEVTSIFGKRFDKAPVATALPRVGPETHVRIWHAADGRISLIFDSDYRLAKKEVHRQGFIVCQWYRLGRFLGLWWE